MEIEEATRHLRAGDFLAPDSERFIFIICQTFYLILPIAITYYTRAYYCILYLQTKVHV